MVIWRQTYGKGPFTLGGGGGEESESSLGQTKLFSHNHKFVADLLLIEMCLQVYKWYRLATRWTYDI